MKLLAIGLSTALAALAAFPQQNALQTRRPDPAADNRVAAAIERGASWLASVQGSDGGWGQDGAGTSYTQIATQGLESTGNDVANTAVAALALLEAGPRFRPNVERAVEFVLGHVEPSPLDGLGITAVRGTQIQRKLGPYIDTFLAAALLADVDGTFSNSGMNRRVRQALEKVVDRIQWYQQSDGSWNIDGGWAPILGTSLASRSLFEARERGLAVDENVMARAEAYTVAAIDSVAVAGGASRAPAEAAGVALYQSAQALEQLTRTEADRRDNADQIAQIQDQLRDGRFVAGFGSIGGEEFFSYLNVSDGLKRAGGPAWNRWHADITTTILDLQNNDGTWAGHHCITGRVAVTSAAILNLAVDHAD